MKVSSVFPRSLLLAIFLTAVAGCEASVPGVGNFDTVDSGVLHRGAAPTPAGVAQLRDRGIRTIVDLQDTNDADERAAAEKLGIKYVQIPMRPWPFVPSNAKMIRFLAVVLCPANQPVFVHCQFGKDRTGAAVAVYRRVIDGWSADSAIADLHAHEGLNALFFPDIPAYVRQINAKAMRREALRQKCTE